MAADIEEPASSEKRRKRKRINNNAKLLVDDKVEVRSVEEGFRGSWHSGTVIYCEHQAHWVKYDHLLRDDGSENLIDCVGVPLVVDGIVPANRARSNYRGFIRPLPPPLGFGKWCLHYGQCVDAYYQEAWWEGVVFDHEDGSEVRKVFFPDMGDVMDCGIEMLRITQDWNEFTEDWKPRGNWLFLELIEEFEQEWPLQVSVRQIWYDVRGKNGFEKLKDWTSSVRDLWKKLVSQVLYDNFKITLKEFFHKFDSSGDLIGEAEKVLGLFEPALDLVSKPEADLGKSLAVVPFENDGLATRLLLTDGLNDASVPPPEEEIDRGGVVSAMDNGRLDTNVLTSSKMPCHEGTMCVQPTDVSILPFYVDEFSRISSNTKSEGYSSTSSKTPNRKLMSLTHRKSHKWLPAGHDLVPEAECCPDAVTEYNHFSNSRKRPSSALTLNVRKHLAYLGWKIQFVRDKGILRLRYTSPDGKCYLSLRKLCQDLSVPGLEIISLFSQDDKRSSSAAPDGPSSSPRIIQPRARKREPVKPSPDDYVVIISEFCPQAVVDYYSFSENKSYQGRWWNDAKVKELQSKAKSHLSAVGWLFWFSRTRGKREMRYTSPRGKVYYSLPTACKGCMDDGVPDSSASICRPWHNINVSKQAEGQLASEGLSSALIGMEFQGNLVAQNALSEKWPTEYSGISLSRELVELSKVKVRGIRELRKKRKNGELHLTSHLLQMKDQNVGFPMLKKGKESRSLIKSRNDWDGNCPTRVLRSSKRARQVVVPSSSHHNPRTVLSWLIDNNVVLPRAKVHYCGTKDHHPMAEGRITRDGIKCSCCQKNFTLSKFEAHAGSTYHRPSANIFLDDGRSLLDCQLQLKRDNNMRSFITEPHEMKSQRHHSTNDYICSVCHFGGELVLCDQCPSSFHTTCLGLKDVPDGDWFCPSCCCGICGESRFNKDTEQFMYNSVLNCDQCEHQYHIGCLKKTGLIKLDNYPKGNWFCNKRCKQIFLGLRRLLGKPVPVGKDNLTWTLLKYVHDASDNEASAENYSKLNVALGVMHECFEPVKESRTRRDLVEDVIFSRWSELNRLNFRGFYTVLLERNDELITVATVRIYGKKVAEVPLVGTRFQYRRLGMCRILMNELEKKLMELGVERLVLPAVPSVLNTWTTSFGFSKMTESERLNFLDYTFLDFQGTIMCQKLLMKIPSTESNILRGSQRKFHDDINGSNNIDLDGNSAVSEVFQADQIEEIVDQGAAYIAGGDGSNSMSPLVVVENQWTCLECIPYQSEISLDCSVEDVDHKEGENTGNGLFKCYKRRRISACES
uniref:PHD finger transcription factor n=1 Tax=Davidia involucrata TaxID=16924 RepID=A0A5B7BUP7_DAVIN